MTKGKEGQPATPYADLLPPLSTEEYERLFADIAANGQRVPILVDEATGDLIDGHHRLRVCQELGLVPDVRVVEVAHAKALALTMNLNRRNLSPEQRAEVRASQQAIAWEMNAADFSQAEIGAALGVARNTVSEWLSNVGSDTPKADQRVTIPPKARPEIVARVDDGQKLKQVAADFGVSVPRISQIVNAEKAKQAEAEARQSRHDALQADAEGDGWKMLHGDFRERLLELEPGSVDLIVTDPPYPAEFLPLLSDLSEIAAKILRPQGVCVVLCGKIGAAEYFRRLAEHLSYGWIYCQPLPGEHLPILGRKVAESWKPWLAFSNGPWPSGRIEWHPDVLGEYERSKDSYRWEQSWGPAAELMSWLSEPDALVVDPFTGVGSYGEAALATGRRFVGVEMDGERFAKCVERLS